MIDPTAQWPAAEEPDSEMQQDRPGAPGAAEQPSERDQEVAELKDRLLRTLAEMENLRRRTAREIADTRAYGVANFARDMLGVSDNMQRALAAISADLREQPEAASLIEGVELTQRELLNTLEKHGVRKFEPLGEKFDPNLHQAMYEIPDPSLPSGTVAQVLQAGYMIGDRVLRAAMVGVSKGGPKVAAAEPAVANENPGAGGRGA